MVRRILPAILSKTRLTDEILPIVFCEVEGIINGRPLTKLFNNPDDLSQSFVAVAWRKQCPAWCIFTIRYVEKALEACSASGKSILELQRRIKWTRTSPNLRAGAVVIILDEMTPRNLWPLARVTEVIHGRDGLLRTVKVKTKRTELVRPKTKVVLLEAGHLIMWNILSFVLC